MNKKQVKVNKYYLAGTVTKPHGIKGEVKVLTDFLKKDEELIFYPKNIVYFLEKDTYKPLIINTVRKHKEVLLISFNEFINLDEVNFLRGKSLYYSERKKKDDLFLPNELIGFNLLNTENKSLGVVTGYFLQTKKYYSLLVKLVSGKEINIPWIENILVKINFSKQEIILKNDALIFRKFFNF